MYRRASDLARYGNQHQVLRRRWKPTVATGTVHCARCGELIGADQQWDLDHLDNGESRPSHATCNRGAPGLRRDPPADPITRW